MKIMLDSGAFSVWKSGASINLQEYILFCQKNPGINYYVNLDVISKTKGDIENTCKQSWENYMEMTKKIPVEKILPVYHLGGSFKWLDRYLEKTQYVGLGGLATNGLLKKERMGELLTIKKNYKGVKFHGFGLASLDVMKMFPWHSVDSTTWSMHSAVWQVLIPKRKHGENDYLQIPLVVRVSPRGKIQRGGHINSLSPLVKKMVEDYILDVGAEIGEYSIQETNPKSKLIKGEYWLDKTKTKKVCTVKTGIVSDVTQRGLVNIRFFRKMADELKINFYFSGSTNLEFIENAKDVGCCLVSFNNIPKGFQEWLLKIKK